ncbi:MAG TPA: hypothetical protein VJA16_23405 [Thermoanaerobaculia bacterium]
MRHSVGSLAVLAVLAVLALAALPAQTQSKSAAPEPATGKAPSHSVARPDAALEQLDSLLGNWSCTGTITGPKGAKDRITARATFRKELDGFWRSLNYQVPKSEASPLHASAVGHLGHCSAQSFTLVLIGGRGNYFVEHSAGWEGNNLVFLGEVKSPTGVAKSRDTFTKDGDKRFTHTVELQEGEAWTRITDERCTRQ